MSKNEITIRLTNFCNETCDHCLFRSGPFEKFFLSINDAQRINRWLPSNEINITFLGGEVTLIPNYHDLIKIISKNKQSIGIITNGIFIKSSLNLNRFLELIKSLSNETITIRISQSQYHSEEEYGILAYNELVKKFNNKENIFIQKAGLIDTIIPIGRAYDKMIGISNWNNFTNNSGAMCRNALNNSIFIDEKAFVHWCPMGNSIISRFDDLDYERIKAKIIDWREAKLQIGMTCLLCSKNGVGTNTNIYTPLNIEDNLSCVKGGYNN